MKDSHSSTPAAADNWKALCNYTAARIALGHAGSGLPTSAHLAFQLAHAKARDAVHTPLDTMALTAQLSEAGHAAIVVESAAGNRAVYLARPDLGRRLSDPSLAKLSEPMVVPDVAIVAADGLSSTAVTAHATAVIAALTPLLKNMGKTIAPVIVATQGRVALGDHIGEILQAKLVIVLIGERPGLSAFDSLGIYITWMPHCGRTDAERNCISNVRAGGLSPADAAAQAANLIEGMFQFHIAGVALSARLALPSP